MKMIVDANRCPQNHRCPAISVCPKQAITQKSMFSLPVVEDEKCIVCGKCVRYCPMGAIHTVEDKATR